MEEGGTLAPPASCSGCASWTNLPQGGLMLLAYFCAFVVGGRYAAGHAYVWPPLCGWGWGKPQAHVAGPAGWLALALLSPSRCPPLVEPSHPPPPCGGIMPLQVRPAPVDTDTPACGHCPWLTLQPPARRCCGPWQQEEVNRPGIRISSSGCSSRRRAMGARPCVDRSPCGGCSSCWEEGGGRARSEANQGGPPAQQHQVLVAAKRGGRR